MIPLLDVNLLLALAWKHHIHNPIARNWFSRNAANGWATCPHTQAGLVRLLMNPVFTPNKLKPARAIAVLTTIVSHPSHVFWPDDLPMTDKLFTPVGRIRGHRQVADAHLLGLCLRHSGRLATLDRGILDLCATAQQRQAVELIDTTQP